MNKFLVFVVAFFMSFSVYAQDSKRQSVEELLRLTNVDAMVDNIYLQMGQAFEGMGKQLGVTPEEQPIFDAYMKKVFETLRKDMNWKAMEAPMIDIYMKHYSEKELQDMVVFYKSETGRSVIKKMPIVMKDSIQLSQQMMQSFFPKMRTLAEELKRELKEKRAKK